MSGVLGPVRIGGIIAPVARILEGPRCAGLVSGGDEPSGEVAERVMLLQIPTPLGRDVLDPRRPMARAQARAMGDGVAGARGGDEDEVEIASSDLSLESCAKAIAQHVVAGPAVRCVDGSDVEAASSQAGCEVQVVALAREDDKGRGPRPRPPNASAPVGGARWFQHDGCEGWLACVRLMGEVMEVLELTLHGGSVAPLVLLLGPRNRQGRG